MKGKLQKLIVGLGAAALLAGAPVIAMADTFSSPPAEPIPQCGVASGAVVVTYDLPTLTIQSVQTNPSAVQTAGC